MSSLSAFFAAIALLIHGPAAVPKLLVPAYFDPRPQWKTMCSDLPAGSTVVANPDNGPGAHKQASYTDAIRGCQSHGVRVIGYVYTGSGTRPLAATEAAIARWYSFYPLDGVFLDEMSDSPRRRPYYASLKAVVHARHGIVVGNPGDNASTNWQLGVTDLLVTFESSAADFAHYKPSAWVLAAQPRRIAVIVYSATLSACAGAGAGNAGSVYVSDLGLPNPYDALPSYWDSEVANC